MIFVFARSLAAASDASEVVGLRRGVEWKYVTDLNDVVGYRGPGHSVVDLGGWALDNRKWEARRALVQRISI